MMESKLDRQGPGSVLIPWWTRGDGSGSKGKSFLPSTFSQLRAGNF